MTVQRSAGLPQGMTLVVQSALPAMGAVLLVPVLPLIFTEFRSMPGADYWIPALVTVPALCIALLSSPAGWIADYYGRRIPLLIALIFYGLTGLAPLFLESFTAIFASRVILGVCEAMIITVSATLVGDYWEGPRRAKWLAAISTMASASAVALFGISGALGSAFGWRGSFALYGVALLFVPALLLWIWEPARSAQRPAAAVKLDAATRTHMIRTGLGALLGGVLFYTLVLQQGLGLAAVGTTDPGRIGLLTACASAANVIGTLVFRSVTTIRPTRLLTVEFLIIGLAMLAISRVTSDVQFAAAAFIGLLGCGMLMPTLLNWTMMSLPFEVRARGTGVFQSMFMLGQFVSSFVMIGVTHAVTGSVLASFGIIGVIAVAAAAGAFVADGRIRNITRATM